jgi:hypothetical protein
MGLARGFSKVKVLFRDGPVITAAQEEMERETDKPLFLFVNLGAAHSPYMEGPGPFKLDDREFLDPDRGPEWVRRYVGNWSGIPGVNFSRIVGDDKQNGLLKIYTGELEIPPDGLKSILRLYDAGVRAADFGFGRILKTWISTHSEGAVVVTSDHGEAFLEHKFIEHRISVYPEVSQVPLVIAAPGRIPPGARVTAPVRLEWIYGTLLDLAGVSSEATSLLDWIDTPPTPQPPVHAATWPDPSLAARLGGSFAEITYLYREAQLALMMSGDDEKATLYDVSTDPGMQRDIGADFPEEKRRLVAAARKHFGKVAPPGSPSQILEISEETARLLREMGYAQ